MKILFAIYSLAGGGAERVLVNLSDEFIKQGHDVGVYIKKNTISYSLDYNIKIYYQEPRLHGVPTCLKRIVNYWQQFVFLKKVISEYKPDIIIASWGTYLLHVLLAHHKIPIIASEHNTFDRKHKLVEKINRFYLNRYFKKVVVLTRYDKAYMANMLRNTIVIPNPLTFTPLTTEEYNASFDSRKHILACGRLNFYYVKGFDNLIKSYALIAIKHPDWDLDIAGTGDEKSISLLKNIAHRYGVQNRVNFLGFQNDISTIMKQHSIFVLSSRSEGFGMVLAEAMAMGCACISYDLSGPSEIIIDGVDGILVESQNENALGASLDSLIGDVDKRKELGRNAICNVKRFNPEIVANKWLKMFDVIINK